MPRKLNILIVVSELAPFAKEGGLADMIGSLSKELNKNGHDVRLVMPRYYTVNPYTFGLQPMEEMLSVPMGMIGMVRCKVLEGKLPLAKVPVYFIDHEQYFSNKREGGLYQIDGQGYLDNDNRFVFLSRASLELCKKIKFRPDVIHVNDWHTSAVPVFLSTVYRDDPVLGKAATLLTIHNIQHQGEFYEGVMDVLGIGWEHFNHLELEKDGNTNLLKGGIYHSTLINTVSESYAHEIQTPEFGYGLDGVLRDRKNDFYGILNGVDYSEWNPESDPFIAANYSEDNLSGKTACKKDLQRTFGLPERNEAPVIGIISRLVRQKGIDILAEAIYRLFDYDIQIVLLGGGEIWTHFYFGGIPKKYPEKFACYIGYDNRLAHKIEAGSDFFLMPSRFEPCGLNQMYSLRYGTLPIVRNTGGLNETVENFDEKTQTGTGFKFWDLTADAIYNTVGWAVYTYYNDKEVISKLIRRAMKARFTWEDSIEKYERLYYLAVKKRLGKIDI